MFRFGRGWPLLAAIAAALLGSSPAMATYELTIQEVTSAGAIVFTNSYTGVEAPLVDPNLGFLDTPLVNTGSFRVTVSAFENAYASPAGAIAQLELHTLTATRTAGNTNYLRLFLTKDGYGGYPAGQALTLVSNLSSISNISAATVTFQSFVDTANTPYGVPAGTNVPPPPGNVNTSPPLVVSATASSAPRIDMDNTNNTTDQSTSTVFIAGGTPVSLTGVATVSGLAVNQSISFDANTFITPVPGALTMLLSGMPVLAVGGFLRRRKSPAVAG